MYQIAQEEHTKLKAMLATLELDRQSWWSIWRELADYYLPRRYVSLMSPQERKQNLLRNPNILDGTGTAAARTLASGMMNGITSPTRPWFKLRIKGRGEDLSNAARKWLDSTEREMMLIMAESNFYNALAVMYLDLVIFGTAAMIIYEDYESIIRCYNPAMGEYYVAQSHRLQVNQFARQISLKSGQLADWFGKENLSDQTRAMVERGGADLQRDINIVHMILPRSYANKFIPKKFPYYECYWEQSAPLGKMLGMRGFNEFPVIAPRWELAANDSYGSCPAMDAFGDVVQLQFETKKKAQGLDKMVDPPVIADAILEHRRMSLLPRGVTYVANPNGVGVKPAYTVTPPIQELAMDIRDVQGRIRETFHNDLFRMISQLDTVRSATEIDARREEKLVLLGPVLERFETEGLDPAINRIYAIGNRAGRFAPPPEEIAGGELEIQYVSILASAQRAVGTVAVERWLALIGELAGAKPEVLTIPDFDELVRGYGRDLGVPAAYVRDPEQTAKDQAAMQEMAATDAALQQGSAAVKGAETLSKTDVGGGANALQRLLG